MLPPPNEGRQHRPRPLGIPLAQRLHTVLTYRGKSVNKRAPSEVATVTALPDGGFRYHRRNDWFIDQHANPARRSHRDYPYEVWISGAGPGGTAKLAGFHKTLRQAIASRATRVPMVRVSATDIRKGVRREPKRCPVALAIGRATGQPWVASKKWLLPASHENEAYPRILIATPPRLKAFMEAFDEGRPVRPFSFKLQEA
jgi:hypothetical protein